MDIACLGWGSLVWDPRDLPLRSEWFPVGPLAPIEFKRKSSDGSITLVIDTSAAQVRVLWALMLPSTIQPAKEALRRRERLTSKNWEKDVGVWQTGDEGPGEIPDLPTWTKAHSVDAVIWTALGPKLDEIASPSVGQIIEYLTPLTGQRRYVAERYIRRAPRQIDTQYRRKIEEALGWSPM